MQYANAYDPDNLQWLENLQELFIRNRAGYDYDGFSTPLPSRIYEGDNFVLLPENNGYLSVSDTTISVFDWEGKEQFLLKHPRYIEGVVPSYGAIISWDSGGVLYISLYDGTVSDSILVGGKIEKVALHPTGDGFAVLTDQNKWQRWLFNGEKILEQDLGNGNIYKVVFTETGKTFYLKGEGEIGLFDENGTSRFIHEDADILDFQLIPDDKGILAHTDSIVYQMDWTGQSVLNLPLGQSIIKVDIIDHESGWVCWTKDNKVARYNWEGQLIDQYTHEEEEIEGVFVASYTTKVVIWSDYECFIWDWAENTVTQVGGPYELIGTLIDEVNMLPDFSGFATWSIYETNIRLWNWVGEQIGILPTPSFITGLEELVYDGEGYLSSSWKGGLRKWDWWQDWKGGQMLHRDYNFYIEEVLVLPKGEGFAIRRKSTQIDTPSNDQEPSTPEKENDPYEGENSILILNWIGDTISQLHHDGPVLGIHYLPDPIQLYASWAADSTVRFWNLEFEEIHRIDLPAPVKKAHFAGEDSLPLFWLENGNLFIPEMGEIPLSLDPMVSKWLFTSQSKIFFWPTSEIGIQVYEFGEPLSSRFYYNNANVGGIIEVPAGLNPSLRPSEPSFISWNWREIYFWDQWGIESIQRIRVGSEGVKGVELHPSGSGILAWTNGGNIYHYSWEGDLLNTLYHDQEVIELRVFQDQERIVAWYRDCLISIWDYEGNLLVQMEHPGNEISKICSVDGFQFLPNEAGMISWSDEETGFLIWDSKGNLMTRIDDRRIDGIHFLPNDSRKLIAWSNQEIRIWSLNPSEILKTGNDIGIPDFTDQEKDKYGIDLDLEVDWEYSPYSWLRD
jgi:WD40 repeat protein